MAACVLLPASVAQAAGGAHVVDDSVVETPGVCHLESWATRLGPRRGLINLSPACTRDAWPAVEIGAALQRGWDGAAADTTVGPALKVALRPETAGLGLGVIGSGAWNLSSSRLDAASLVVPVTLTVNRAIRVNLNAGWSHVRADTRRDAAFYGVQGEWGVGRDLTMMIEAFQRGGADAGGQAGIRWNPGGGRFDLDLIAGRRVDGTSPRAVTLGLTVRR